MFNELANETRRVLTTHLAPLYLRLQLLQLLELRQSLPRYLRRQLLELRQAAAIMFKELANETRCVLTTYLVVELRQAAAFMFKEFMFKELANETRCVLTTYLVVLQQLGLCQEKEVDKQAAAFEEVDKQAAAFEEVARLCSLSNKKRELHKFIQNVSQITSQIKIKKAHEICKEGHDNTSIEILDKMTVVTDVFKLHFSWTKAPRRHRSQNNASDLKKSCTSFDGCYKHQDCMSTVKLEICIDFCVDDMEKLQKLFYFRMPFFCSEYNLLRYGGKIESQGFHAIGEPIAPADDEPDSRCELTHISHCTRSPPGPNGLPDGEEMPQQDSPKHQLMRETHAMNDGENVLSEDAIHSAVSYPEIEGTRKTLKREHGKIKIQIPLEDLLNFSGTLMDAVKQFQVSKSTIKRICRRHGITNWQCRTIDKNSQSFSEPKGIIESTQGAGAEMGNQMAGGSESRERELNHEQFGFPPESEKSLDMSQCIQASGELLKDHNISAIVAFNTEQVPESSQTNLSCSIPVPKLPEATAAHMMPLVTEMQDTRTVTIKATYRGDMIRFQHSLTSGITELKREVAESLKLEVDTFSIKYLDDDDDWILMTGDKDLHECFKISVSLGRKFIKLSIHKK